ncbi:MAG: hypothetical protein LW709_00980, partial [Oxalobacteraceae bacterium]|nr:hypothetical protein [Oxalobacteraceae bacterium]
MTTRAAVDSAMVSATSSGFITPVSTIYAYAEAAGAGSGAALLNSLGLQTADLAYDPSATINTNANAATVLKTGASLLTMVSNAASLVSSVGGVSADVAVKSVFSQISTLGTGISDLLSTNSATSQAKLTAVMRNSLTSANSSVDVSSFTDVIAATSQSVAAVTTALQNLSSDAIKAGSHLSIAATGQTTLLADIKSVAALVAAGDANAAAKITALTTDYSSATVNTLAAAAATKLAFNTQDPNNPIKTSADTVTIGAPVGNTPVVRLFDILKNDSITVNGTTTTGGGALDLAAVGIFTANARNGAITASTSNSITLESAASADANAYKGMSVTLMTRDGSITRLITDYNSTSKVATLDSALSADELADVGSNASYLISKALPSNIGLAIVNDQLQITNAPVSSASLEVGQLQLVYVAQKADDPTVAKTGLVTVNVLPPKPTIAFASGSTITASEAVDGVTAGPQAPVVIAGRAGEFTAVDAPLTLTGGLGLTGTIQISGLPTGALLQVGSSVTNQAPMIIAKDVGSNFWTISQQSAPAANLASLKLLIPSDLAGTYSLSAIATARYGGLSSQSSTLSASLVVTPSADGLVLAGGDAGALAAFTDQAIPDALTEDTAFALVSSETTPAIDQLVNSLQQRRGDTDGSEFLGLKFELPQGWNASFTSNAFKQVVTALADKTTVEIYATDAIAASLKDALAALRLTPALNYSGDATLKLTAGTFEAASAVNGIPSSANFKLLPEGFNTNVSVAPVTDIPAIQTTAFAANWSQTQYLRDDGFYAVPVSVSVSSIDTVAPDETLYIAVGRAELDAVGASLNVAAATPITIGGKAYFRFPAGDGTFEIVAPSSVSKPLGLSLLVGASDQGAAFVYSDAKTLSIPFTETPKKPTFSIKATSGYNEDDGIALSDLLLIAPGAGRSLVTHKVFIKLPEDKGYTLSKSGTLIARTNDVVIGSESYAVADLSTGGLSDYKIMTPANFKGTVAGLKVFVRDTASTGTFSDADTVTTPVTLSAVADGINVSLLDGIPELNLNVGVESKLYDPTSSVTKASSLFSKIVPLDSSESYSAKLVFKATASNAVAVKVGSEFVLPQTVGDDLVYSFTSAQFTGATPITITARSGLFGKAVELQAFTTDGAVISGVASKTVTVNLSAQAVAPDASLSNASGAEDTPIPVPVSVTVNPDRAGFEKIGFEITTTNTLAQGGVFSVGNQVYAYSAGKWTVFSNTAQLDFSALTFTPPNNFSGTVNFSFTSFSQTAAGRVSTNATPVTVEVAAVAEVVQRSDGAPAGLSGPEDGLGIEFPLASYFKTATFTDADEKVTLEVSLPAEVILQKLATGTSYTNLIPIASSAGTTTYSITVDATKFQSELLGYRLLAGKDYASPTASGSAVTIKALSYEPSTGAQSAPATQTVNLTITP